MELDELASQFGGKRVQTDSSDDLAAQFGGKKIVEASLDDDLAAQFGGKKIGAVQQIPKEEPPKEEKPSILAGTKLGPEERITPFNSPADLSSLPKFDTSKMSTAAERTKAAYEVTPDMNAAEAFGQNLKQIGRKASINFMQGWGGAAQFAQDVLGVEDKGVKGVLGQLSNEQKVLRDVGPESYLGRITSDATTSIITQLPALVSGAVLQSQIVPLTNMFMQSFGQTYDDSRRAGLDIGDSTGRSALYGAFEVVGEKFGLGNTLEGIKAAAKGVPLKELATYFSKALVKEIPGEQLTYAGQFAVDKGYGMNPEAGIKEFLQGAADTLVSTVVQGGMMLGGGAAANRVAKEFNKKAPEEDKVPTARELMEQQGFVPKKTETALTTETPVTTPLTQVPEKQPSTIEAAPAAPVEATPAQEPLTKDYLNAVTRYEGMGLSRADSERLAEQELKEAGYEPELITRARESSISTPDVQADVSGTTQGTTGTESVGLGGTSGTPGNVGVGTENERSALVQSLKAKYNLTDEQAVKAADESLRQKQIVQTMGESAPPSSGTITPSVEEEANVTPSITQETAPVVTKGKTGRPKAVLTPEEQAAKAEVRKGSQAATRDAIRLAEKSKKILSETFDPEEFESINAAEVAQNEFNERRRQALEDAHILATSPAHRNNKAGTVAKALLEQVTPQERELAKNRAEIRTKLNAPSRTEIVEYTNGEDNPKFETFTQARAALTWLTKNGNEFEKALARRLAPYLNGVKLVVVDSHLDLPSKSLQNSMNGAVGLYVAGRNTIYLLRNGGINSTVFLHEALHGATVKRINSYLQAKLEGRPIPNDLRVAVAELYETMDEAKQLYDTLKAQGMLNNQMLAIPYNAFTDIKEFVAYGLTTPAMQEFLALAPGEYFGEKPGVISKLFTRFVQSLRTMFNMGEEHKSALQDLIIITDKLLRTKEQEVTADEEANAAKKVNTATKKVDKTEEKIRLSNNSTNVTKLLGEMIREGRSFEDYKDLFNASFSSLENETIAKMLFNLQTVDILRWKGDEIPGLNEVDKLQQEMAAMRTHMLAASAKKADKLGAFIRKNGMQTLSDTMHTARLEKVSPTKAPDAATYIAQDPIVKHYDALIADPNSTKEQRSAYTGQRTKRIKSINKVYEKWDALSKQKGGHEMYEMVRQFYIDNYTATRTILNDQIEALSIDDAAKEKLLKSVRLMQEQTKGGQDEDYDNIDVKSLPEEYFPFLRYGKYWLRVAKGPTGREFYLFENGGDRNRFLLKRAKELGLSKDDANFSAGDDITSLRKDFQDSSVMLQEMFAAIDSTAVDPKFDSSKYATAAEANLAFKEELKDQLYQTYLMTMPERSFRKQFLHAENVTGFTSDIFRNFKNSATSYANQLSKLKYGTEITNQVQRARDSLEGMPAMERAKLEIFVNEIGARAQEEINPPDPGKAATRINQFAFLMLLTSAASAATQMASVPIMVMPSLNAEYGYGASAKAFAKYSQIWKSMGVTQEEANGDVTYTAPSIGSSKMVKSNPILQRAFEAALDRHVTTLTNTSVLTNRNRTPDSSFANMPGTAARVAFNGITGMFNGSERMSRELTYMMAFELEYAKSKDFNRSVDKAVDTTHELLGRYDNFNRPRILRNTLGKTVGQFKMYAVFMTSFFLRNGYQIIRLTTPAAERMEAMHRLAGVLTMGGMFHGLVGMPMYSVICATIDAFFSGDDEEKKRRRAKNPLTAEDANLRFRYDFLPNHFGNITVKGVDGRQHRLSDMLEKGPISALTDINIGSRTSFDGMWFRAAKPGKTYLETAQNFILANMGPGVSTGVNMVGAVDDFNNGHITRGLEKLVPAFFKGSLTAFRLSKEGAETKGGADMLKKEEINTLNLIATTLGFQSSRLARIQEHNFEMQKQLTEAQNKRAAILKRLDEVAFDAEKGPGDLKTVFNQIREYNKRYPMEKFMIEADTIDSSLKTYAKKRGLTYRGQYMDEKLIPYLLPSARKAAPIPEKQ